MRLRLLLFWTFRETYFGLDARWFRPANATTSPAREKRAPRGPVRRVQIEKKFLWIDFVRDDFLRCTAVFTLRCIDLIIRLCSHCNQSRARQDAQSGRAGVACFRPRR